MTNPYDKIPREDKVRSKNGFKLVNAVMTFYQCVLWLLTGLITVSGLYGVSMNTGLWQLVMAFFLLWAAGAIKRHNSRQIALLDSSLKEDDKNDHLRELSGKNRKNIDRD